MNNILTIVQPLINQSRQIDFDIKLLISREEYNKNVGWFKEQINKILSHLQLYNAHYEVSISPFGSHVDVFIHVQKHQQPEDLKMIYLVYRTKTGEDGRGPDELAEKSGYFESEEEAWKFANKLAGWYGKLPKDRDWRNDSDPDFKVVRIPKNGKEVNDIMEKSKEIEALEKKIRKLQDEINSTLL